MSADDYSATFFDGSDKNTAKLIFGTAVGQWTFTAGKWPAINLPSTVGGNYTAEDQPTEP